MTDSSTGLGRDPRVVPDDLEAEAVRRRIAARMFGARSEPVALGRFKVLRILGEGGMGRVYLAEDDQLRRTVALKVIRPRGGANTDDDRARLLREARALARLSHPNVVHVYDVGAHGDDVFIAMEHVAGQTLDRWLAARRRTVAEILDVFLAAAHGLAAAHAAGITHRDFKPSNVVVGDDGRIRILDFGLARELGDVVVTIVGSSDERSSAPAGTPEYMSPEHRAGRADARSDQFSFCVALDEALRSLDGGPPGWLRRAAERGRALAPEARFPSMQALIRVLERGRRRRRRMMATAAAVLLLGAAIGLGARMSTEPAPCAEVGRPLVAVWSPARRSRLEQSWRSVGAGEASSRVLAGLDDYALRWLDRRVDACAATRLRGEQSEALLDRSMRCLDRGLQRFATLVDALGRPDPSHLAAAPATLAALPDPSECRDRARLDADDRPRPSARAEALARRLDLAAFMQHAHRGPAALATAQSVLADSRADGELALEAEALLRIGSIFGQVLRDSPRATAALHEAQAKAVAAGHTAILWEIWNELARVEAVDHEDPQRARAWLANARGARAGSADSTSEAILLETEALIALAESRPGEAVELHRRALAQRVDHDPARVFGAVLLANALAEAGRPEEALASLSADLDEQRTRWGHDHPLVAIIEQSLALVHLDLDAPDRAAPLLVHARSVLAAAYGEGNPRVASADLALSVIAAAAADLDGAIARAQAALAVFESAFGPTYSERIAALAQLAELYRRSERHAEALAVNQRLLDIADDHSLDLDQPGLLVNIGDYLCLLDRCGASLPYFSRLAAALAQRPPDDPSLLPYALQGIGRAHLANGDPAQALPLLEEAHRGLSAHPGRSLHVRAQVARLLAECLRALHLTRRARAVESEARSLERQLADSPTLARHK